MRAWGLPKWQMRARPAHPGAKPEYNQTMTDTQPFSLPPEADNPDRARRRAAVDQIAAALGETNPRAIWQLNNYTKHKGTEAALALLQRTLDLEAQGGMLVPNGSRRRTPGGVYFALASETLTADEQVIVFPPPTPQKPKADVSPAASAKPPAPSATDTPPTPAAPPPAPVSSAEVEIAPLARQLGTEMGLDHPALTIIHQALQAIGADELKALAQQARADAKEGGIVGLDGTHLLKPGEIFVYSCYGAIPAALRTTLTPPAGYRVAPRPAVPKPITAKPALAPKAAPQAGTAAPMTTPKGATVKATVVGRPQKVERHQDHVVLTLTTGTVPALPKGLPTPPGPWTATVYVALKQWAKVEPQLAAHADDIAIIDGFTTFDGQRVAIYASNCTTKLLQQAKKESPTAKTPASG